MKLTLKSTQVKELLEIDGFDGVLEDLGFDADWRYYTTQGISLIKVETDVLVELAKMFRASKVRGTLTMAEDIESYIKLRSRSGKDKFNHKARKCQHFAENLIEALRNDPRHHLYQYESERNVWFASYIWDVEYHHEVTRDGWTEPEHVTLNLGWNEFGQGKTEQMSFLAGDTVGLTIVETLQRKSLFIEDDTRRTTYLESIKRFQELRDQVGLQCLAEGIGDDLEAEDRHWWRNTIIRLDRDGLSHVVIDVFSEDDDEENSRRYRRSHSINDRWWVRFDDEDTDDDESDSSEIPTHPMVAVFDLKRHIRLRVHITQLKEYEYDQSLSDKLILPAEHRELIDALLSYTGTFQDIIAGKGGGATILCSGGPGTGKTLTAEVYAEVMKRPLYTVQCSQLGTDPQELEKNIQTIFARSYRWNSVLLLDEADVYVAERGNSLEQNAIVGVFLRVLEYYRGVLFLTTNRGDHVDDAVASRCIARIEYTTPPTEDARKIWRILSNVQFVTITDDTISMLIDKFPNLSGRDIKNLLKLAKLVANDNPITVDLIEMVKKFKPTK